MPDPFFIHNLKWVMPGTILLLAACLFSVPSISAAGELPFHPNRAEIGKLDDSACENGFSFAVMGDSHSSTTVFPAIIEQLKEIRPAFAFTVGDFTNNGLVEEYQLFVNQINSAGIPWFVVPGNHEYRDPSGHTSLSGQKRYKKVFGTSDFFFDYCGWRFIGLDVVAYDTLLPAQLKKLDSALEGRGPRSAVFMHYPPAIIEHWEEGIFVSSAKSFMRILEQRSARFFFSGHIHVFDTKTIGPTTYIITGGAGGTPDSDRGPANLYSPESGAFRHFILVDVRGAEASFEPLPVEFEDN